MKNDVAQSEDPTYEEAFIKSALTLDEAPMGRLSCCWWWAKLLPTVFVLVPLRFVLVLLLLPQICLVCKLSLCVGNPLRCGARDKAGLTSHTWVQRCVLVLECFLQRLLLFVLGFIWISVKGKLPRKFAERAPTIISNHVTAIDGHFFGALLHGQLTGVAAYWTLKMPFFGAIARAHHVLAVGQPPAKPAKVVPELDANNASQAALEINEKKPEEAKQKSATQQIIEYQQWVVESPRGRLPILIFPEGWTKANHCLLQFRTGAFVSGLPVQPVVLRFSGGWHYDPSWTTQSTPAYCLRLFMQLFQWAEVEWLPVYVPSDAERADARLYANNVQEVMARALRLSPEQVSTTVGMTHIKGHFAKQRAERIQPAKLA